MNCHCFKMAQCLLFSSLGQVEVFCLPFETLPSIVAMARLWKSLVPSLWGRRTILYLPGFAFVAYPNRDLLNSESATIFPRLKLSYAELFAIRDSLSSYTSSLTWGFLAKKSTTFGNLLTSRRRRQKLHRKCRERQALKNLTLYGPSRRRPSSQTMKKRSA